MELIEMEDSTPGTTVVPNEDGQQPSPQQQQQAPADTQQTTPTGQTPSTPNDNSGEGTPQVVQNEENQPQNQGGDQQDELVTWAEKQGIDLDNPTPEQTKTLAKRLRDTQKSFHEANSRAKAVDLSPVKDIFNDEPLPDEFADLDAPELKAAREATAKVNGQLSVLNLREFISATPEAEQYAGKMVEILQQEEKDYGKDAARLLSNNHKRLLNLAKAESLEQDTTQAFDEGRQVERQNLAKAQQAAGPATNAVSSAPQSNVVTDKQIGEMSTAEYTAWKAAGNNPWTVASTSR